MTDELYLDPFQRSHVGSHGAFVHRVNQDHLMLARKAGAERMGVPVGAIRIDWRAVKEKKWGGVVKMRRAA